MSARTLKKWAWWLALFCVLSWLFGFFSAWGDHCFWLLSEPDAEEERGVRA